LNSIYGQRKAAAMELLSLLGCDVRDDQSGLFVWAKAPESVQDVEKWIDEILYGTKVFITPGFIFGDAGKRYIRISLCCTVELLQQARTRIQAFLASKANPNVKATVKL
jgi:LL-diaminopimelate aminotransferase